MKVSKWWFFSFLLSTNCLSSTFPHHLPFTLILAAELTRVSEHAASAVIVFGVDAFVWGVQTNQHPDCSVKTLWPLTFRDVTEPFWLDPLGPLLFLSLIRLASFTQYHAEGHLLIFHSITHMGRWPFMIYRYMWSMRDVKGYGMKCTGKVKCKRWEADGWGCIYGVMINIGCLDSVFNHG